MWGGGGFAPPFLHLCSLLVLAVAEILAWSRAAGARPLLMGLASKTGHGGLEHDIVTGQ